MCVSCSLRRRSTLTRRQLPAILTGPRNHCSSPEVEGCELPPPPPVDNGLPASRASALARPNILVYLQDDTDLDYLSVYPHGQRKGSQPNLERLAREGMVFDAALSASPLCVPSRYVYLTGRYPSSCYSSSCRADATRADMQNYVQLEEDKSGALLAAAGYTTGFVGKVHVAPLWTEKQKTQWRLTSELLASGKHDTALLQANLSEQLRQNELRAREVITKEYGFTWAKNLYDENMRVPFDAHNPDWTLAAAREFLERHRHGRFYLHVCTTLMHGSIKSLELSLPLNLEISPVQASSTIRRLRRETPSLHAPSWRGSSPGSCGWMTVWATCSPLWMSCTSPIAPSLSLPLTTGRATRVLSTGQGQCKCRC